MVAIRAGSHVAAAAPALDVSRYGPAQVTTSTATPLIRLTPDTPAPPAAGTADPTRDPGAGPGPGPGAGTVSPGATGTGGADPGTPGTGGSRGAGTAAPGDRSGSRPGVSPGTPGGRPGDPAGPRGTDEAGAAAGAGDLGGPSGSDGRAYPGAGAGAGPAPVGRDRGPASGSEGDAGTWAGAEAEADAEAGPGAYVRRVGPFGLRVEVDEAASAELWRHMGSPRAGRPWWDRLTDGRPGPWGWAWLYPLAVLLVAGAGIRAVRALTALDRPPESAAAADAAGVSRPDADRRPVDDA